MKMCFQTKSPFGFLRGMVALLCAVLRLPGDGEVYAQSSPQEAAPEDQQAVTIPNDQLDLWWHQAHFIQIRGWPRFSWRPPILWKSFSSSSGCLSTRI
jgi:hypothetical protein